MSEIKITVRFFSSDVVDLLAALNTEARKEFVRIAVRHFVQAILFAKNISIDLKGQLSEKIEITRRAQQENARGDSDEEFDLDGFIFDVSATDFK